MRDWNDDGAGVEQDRVPNGAGLEHGWTTSGTGMEPRSSVSLATVGAPGKPIN